MIVTSDASLAERLRRLRTHGGVKTYFHEEVGTNSRLDAVQATVLLAKLPHLAEWNAARRRHAEWYGAAIADLDAVVRPVIDPANQHIFHQYVIAADRRDDLAAHLKARGVGTAIYYPLPLHLQPCFAFLGYREGAFPVAEAAAKRVLALPVYPELTETQRQQVVDAIRGFYGR
jgi:dTDP-4-amino-4,6-dideoxygalactose transaminase